MREKGCVITDISTLSRWIVVTARPTLQARPERNYRVNYTSLYHPPRCNCLTKVSTRRMVRSISFAFAHWYTARTGPCEWFFSFLRFERKKRALRASAAVRISVSACFFPAPRRWDHRLYAPHLSQHSTESSDQKVITTIWMIINITMQKGGILARSCNGGERKDPYGHIFSSRRSQKVLDQLKLNKIVYL